MLDPESPAFCCVCFVRIFDPFVRIFDPLGSLGAPKLGPSRVLRGLPDVSRSPPGPALAALTHGLTHGFTHGFTHGLTHGLTHGSVRPQTWVL